MSRREEQALATRLARALDGREEPDGDVASLVTVLERATEPARFVVAEADIERELVRVRPRLDRGQIASRRPSSRLAVAFGAVATAAIAVVVFTFVQLPGTDIEAKALAALQSPGRILEIFERIEPAQPGAFPVSTRTVWLDPHAGLQRTVQTSRGRVVEETLVKPRRVIRYLPGQDLAIVAPSCRAFASGCADTVDPVAFYRNALETRGVVSAKHQGDVYRLTLPVQVLPDAVQIDQTVTIDARTFLPKLIEWRENGRPVSRIVIQSIKREALDQIVDPFHLSLLASTRIEQRSVSRKPLRKLSEQALSESDARAVRPRLLALPQPSRGIEAVRWNTGTVYRLDYGPVTLWNYRSPVPPPLVSTFISGPAKVVPLGDNVARFYEASGGRWLVEVDMPSWSVAIEAPGFGKVDIFKLARMLRPLR